ncbi:hypothetical protein HDU93_004356 [Gonapodya sp. JEL0774]|nr:hypothetical protein HDU93_004356 [Gonapodya sp. JEL0774]
MIVKRNFNPIKIITYVWFDTALGIISSLFAYLFVAQLGWTFLSWSFAPVGVLGTALSIFLAFRANTSFSRWGEAAQAWATITTASRILGHLVVCFVDAHKHTSQYNSERAEAYKREMIHRVIAWSHALRVQLRKQTDYGDVMSLLPREEASEIQLAHNRPLWIMKRIAHRIYDGMADGTLQGFDSFQMEGQLAALQGAQSVCERIKEIPVPRQYDYFTRVYVHVFVILLPFFLVQTFVISGAAYLVIPISGIVSFLFTTIERTGAVNEDPFEGAITDVPLTSYTRTIERDLKSLLGASGDALPEAIVAVNGYLF